MNTARGREKDGAALSDISLKRIGISVLIGVAVIMLVTLVLAALISGGKLGPKYMTAYAGGAVFIGGAVSSLFACGRRKKLISALMTAAGLLFLLGIIGFGMFSAVFSAKLFLLMLIILLVSCILGSVISSFFK